MAIRRRRWPGPLLGAVAVLVTVVSPLEASPAEEALALRLTLEGPSGATDAGAVALYRGVLTAGGTGVPGHVVELFVGGAVAAQAVTGAGGAYTARVWYGSLAPVAVRAVAHRGTAAETASPPVTVRPAVVPAIATGEEHSCALLADATVRCWGSNWYGQVGDGGSYWPRKTPSPVALDGPAVALTAGDRHSCALLLDGAARCWGYNNAGQVGDGTARNLRMTPVAVSGLSAAVGVAAGGRHTCAVVLDGTARCWGSNTDGQLGNADPFARDTASSSLVVGLAGAVAVASGFGHTCALVAADGSVSCWGDGGRGQMGNGGIADRNTAWAVPGLTGAVAVTAGGWHNCAVLGDGIPSCWGWNRDGQIGDGTHIDRRRPVAVALAGVGALGAGWRHTCAVLVERSARCWGRNEYGQVGDGTSGEGRRWPVGVVDLEGAVGVDGGAHHSCAQLLDGRAMCWGRNHRGQLGDGTTTDRLAPVEVLLER